MDEKLLQRWTQSLEAMTQFTFDLLSEAVLVSTPHRSQKMKTNPPLEKVWNPYMIYK